jgi:hypothetical protein
MRPDNNTLTTATVRTASYNILAETLEGKPSIAFAYDGLTERQMRVAIRCLSRAFRKILITNHNTGEVIYDHYESDEVFCPTETPTEAIDNCMLQLSNI